MLHLPDLPNAGYATNNQKWLSDAIMYFMREIERDRLRLITIVLDGPEKWRRVARGAFGSKAPQDTLDTCYEYLRLQAADGTPYQKQLLGNLNNPVKTRQILRKLWPLIEKQQEQLRIMAKWSPVQKAGWLG